MQDSNLKEKKEKIDMGVWKKFIVYLKPYKKEFIAIGIAMVMLGILDSIFPLLNKYAIDNFIMSKDMSNLKNFIIIFFLSVIGLGITVYSFIVFAGKLETKMAYDLRKMGFEKLQKLSLDYYNKNAVGSLMSRLTSDIARLSETISWGLVDVLWGIALMTVITIVMFRLNAKLALIVVCMLPFLVIISNYFQKKMLKSQRKIRKINSDITAAFNEDIQGAKTTKTLNREDLNLEEFSNITLSMRDQSIRFLMISSIYIPIVLVFGSLITGIVLNTGGGYVLKGALTYGTLIVFISYTSQFFEPINQIAVVLSDVQTAQAAAERYFELINEPLEIVDTEEVIEKYLNMDNPNRQEIPEMHGDIQFKDVNFYYTEEEIILNDFNLQVKAGETVALVGETGSGKSTLVNLVSRFYEPKAGVIEIDGMDYTSLPQKFIHDNLGYVLQTPHLFNGSIRENILYGNLEARDEDVIEACKLVNAHDFIMEFKDGYETNVGEGGSLLSTGQKQLLSFARAIIRNPRLFILDEATSSIDTETELIIQTAINNILKDRTSFVIAHRLSTIKNADKIVVLKRGKIIEQGTHGELLKNKGYYYNLYTNQFLENEDRD